MPPLIQVDLRPTVAVDTTSRRIEDPDLIVGQLRSAVASAPFGEVGSIALQLGDLLLALGEVEDAVDWLQASLDHDPTLMQAHTELIFALDLLSGISDDDLAAERRRFDERFCLPLERSSPRRVSADGPKVGYLTGQLFDHSAGLMAASIIASHRDLDVTVYASAPTDATTAHLPGVVGRWVDVRGRTPHQIAEIVRADGIDVLVDTTGYLRGHHLLTFAERPAPIQVSAWGYLAGMGLSCFDAILTDPVIAPPHEQHRYTERCMQLPYALGFTPPPYAVPIAPAAGPMTFGHLGRAEKISAATLDLWASVLDRVPKSRLLLKAKGLTYARTQRRIRGAFADRGVNPERIEFRGATSRYEHLRTYNEIDATLDTTPQNSGVTAIESLWMGTPVVTLLTERLPGRMAATTLTAIGREDLIARTPSEYVALAQRMVGHPSKTLRKRVEGSVICDAEALARGAEAAYRQLWEDFTRCP